MGFAHRAQGGGAVAGGGDDGVVILRLQVYQIAVVAAGKVTISQSLLHLLQSPAQEVGAPRGHDPDIVILNLDISSVF